MKIKIESNNEEIVEGFLKQLNASLLLGDIQSQHKSSRSRIDSERAILTTEPVALPVKGYDIENKSKELAKLLRRECNQIQRVVQNLSKKERKNRHRSKIGQQSSESLLLNQTANLLWLLSAHVIPRLEQ